MTLYVKKRIPVEAAQFAMGSWSDLEDFTGGLIRETDGVYEVYDRLHDTWVKFIPGDWIIRGLEGEFYPCRREVFENTYERYEE